MGKANDNDVHRYGSDVIRLPVVRCSNDGPAAEAAIRTNGQSSQPPPTMNGHSHVFSLILGGLLPNACLGH